MIKINLVREGRAVRGTGAAPVAAAAMAAPGAPTNVNNILMVALLILGVLGSVGYFFYYKRELDKRRETVEQKTAEAKKLEAIIKEVEEYERRKNSLQQRINLINDLKKNQKGPVRIMDQISRDLPDLVWLDRMEISRGRVSLTGRGLNPNAIALFVENVKNDAYFEEPTVGAVTRVSSSPLVYAFDMNFAFTYTPKTATPPPGTPATTTTGAPTTTAPATTTTR